MVIEGCNNMCAPVLYPGIVIVEIALPSSPLQKFEDESEKTKTAPPLIINVNIITRQRAFP